MASPSWATLGLLCTPGSHKIIARGLSQLQGGAQRSPGAGFSVLFSLLISTARSHRPSAQVFSCQSTKWRELEGPETHSPEEGG